MLGPNKASPYLLQFGDITLDPAQQTIASQLQVLGESLTARNDLIDSWKEGVSRLTGSRKKIQQGIYIWGGVGRGKTFLMDQFYETLSNKKKLRLHFHRFMVLVHEQRKKFDNSQNPLQQVADYFADWANIICLDEIYVTDIVDALIMERLLRGLFERGVTLVVTSNFHPDSLYKDGLQRELFLPAIALIKQHTRVCQLKGDKDYRLSFLDEIETAFMPHDDRAEKVFWQYYTAALGVNLKKPPEIIINQRKIKVERWTNGVVWFDFDVICEQPRSTADYVEIARYFHTVLVQNVEPMDDISNNRARRFISMIDEFYDRKVNFIVSSSAPVETIYSGSKLSFEFQRTSSRLIEMQTKTYLRLGHRL